MIHFLIVFGIPFGLICILKYVRDKALFSWEGSWLSKVKFLDKWQKLDKSYNLWHCCDGAIIAISWILAVYLYIRFYVEYSVLIAGFSYLPFFLFFYSCFNLIYHAFKLTNWQWVQVIVSAIMGIAFLIYF